MPWAFIIANPSAFSDLHNEPWILYFWPHTYIPKYLPMSFFQGILGWVLQGLHQILIEHGLRTEDILFKISCQTNHSR